MEFISTPNHRSAFHYPAGSCCTSSRNVYSVFIFRYALNPVSELSKAMQKVADGDYTVKLDVPGNKSEIYELLNNFNVMVQELNSTETLHSDFISNVSHEFKTPLPPSPGYATLLQDDTSRPRNGMNI